MKKKIIKNSKKPVRTVFTTTNYDMFKFRDDNRVIRPGWVSRLATNMKTKGWVKGSIIVVNENHELIDGQHRLKAAMRVNIPVDYVVIPETGFEEIHSLNEQTHNWRYDDHLGVHVKKANKHYVALNNFMKEFPEFHITEAMMFLMNAMVRVDKGNFESGNFKTKNVELGKVWAKQIIQLRPHFEKDFNKSLFVRAIIRILSKKSNVFVMDEFIHKVKIRPGMLYRCGSVEQYVEMIEKIYNHFRKNEEKVNLRF